jgi:hypothetical protein
MRQAFTQNTSQTTITGEMQQMGVKSMKVGLLNLEPKIANSAMMQVSYYHKLIKEIGIKWTYLDGVIIRLFSNLVHLKNI